MKAWMQRSTPRSVLIAVAVVLGIASILLGQITTRQDRRAEDRRTDKTEKELQHQVDALTVELRCRSIITNRAARNELVMISATGRGLVALTNPDDTKRSELLNEQTRIILGVADDLDRLLKSRESDIRRCSR